MKKTLLLTAVLLLTTGVSLADCTVKQSEKSGCSVCPTKCEQQKREKCCEKPDFAKKLNLTEEQICKSRDLRMKSKERIKPIYDELKSKECQRAIILRSKITQKEQIKMINSLDRDIARLKKQLRHERIKNQKQFEALLTDCQKAELQKLKSEGRKNFEQSRKCKCGSYKYGKFNKEGCRHKQPLPCPKVPQPKIEK